MWKFSVVVFFVVLNLAQQTLFSQENNWCWARQSYYGGGEGYGIASDDSGYVYLTGSFNTDVIRFGSIILHNNNNQETSDYFTVKYDKQGNAIWAKSAGGTGYDQDQGFGITIDNSRNILVIGSFQSREIIFGNDTLYNANQNGNGNNDVFIVKYNTYGDELWVKSFGGISRDDGMGITTDDENNIYITGAFSSSVVNFDTALLNNSNTTGYEIFVAKLDSLGSVIWAKSYGGMSDDLSNSIAIDINGNVLIAGAFKSDIIRFNNLTILNTDTDNNYYDFFVAKISSAGDVIWVNKSQYGNQNDFGWAIATDKEGNAYATGSFNSDSLVFGNYTLNNYGSHDAFLCKYDSLGNVCWVKNQKGMNSEIGYSVAVDTSGNIYVTGGYTYSPGSSAPLIIENLTFPIPFVAGAIEPSYIAKYNTNGILLHAETLVCGGEDIIAVTTNSAGDIYVGGDYYYTVNKFIIGDDTLHKIPGVYEVIFIAKYNCRNLPNVINEMDFESSFTLFPNPTTTELSISGYSPAYLKLCNTLGQTVAEASNTNTLWLGNLPQGFYLLQLFDEKGNLVKTEKVVKE